MKQKHKRIAVTAASAALGLVLPLAAGSIHSHLASASSAASTAPSGSAAASMSALSQSGPTASTAQLTALSSALGLGDPDGQAAGTAGHLGDQASSRVLDVNGVTIVAVPTDAGQVCESTTDQSGGNGTSGCVRDLSTLPGAVAPVTGHDSDGVSAVTGLAADSVKAVSVVTADGVSHPATLRANAFVWNGTSAASVPSSLTVTSTSGQTTTVALSGQN